MNQNALLIVFLTGFGTPAVAATPYFWWDSGKIANQVDHDDLIINVSQGCNHKDVAVNLPGALRARILPKLSIPSAIETKTAFAPFDLAKMKDEYFEAIWVRDSFVGDPGTVFLLLPEAHESPVQDSTAHSYLHYHRSAFLTALLENLKSPLSTVLNLHEGIEGSPVKLDIAFKSTDRQDQLLQIASDGHLSAFRGLGNIFPEIESAYIEKPENILTEILLVLGNYSPERSFEDIYAEVLRSYHEMADERPRLLKQYEFLKTQSAAVVADLKHQLCVTRGNEMAEVAIAKAKQKNASLVLLSYGALHHGEITQVLKQQKISHITVMGLVSNR